MCLTPLHITNRKEQTRNTVPCGKCPECIARRISGWSKRLLTEGMHSSSAYFITLTYDTYSVPITEKGFMQIDKKDLQKFFKRLRKLHNKKRYLRSLKYFAVGEYGGRTYRPHYHIILFNADIKLIDQAWSLDGKPIGSLHYGDVSGASIGYCFKYLSKPSRIPLHVNDDRQKEFTLMSKDWVRHISHLK